MISKYTIDTSNYKLNCYWKIQNVFCKVQKYLYFVFYRMQISQNIPFLSSPSYFFTSLVPILVYNLILQLADISKLHTF